MEACKERKVDRTKHFISMKQVKFQGEEEEGSITAPGVEEGQSTRTWHTKLWHETISAAGGGRMNAPPKAKVTQSKTNNTRGIRPRTMGYHYVGIRPLSVGIRLCPLCGGNPFCFVLIDSW